MPTDLRTEILIDAPPATWDEFVAAGKKLSKDGKWGTAMEGSNPSENVHHAYVFAKQHGAETKQRLTRVVGVEFEPVDDVAHPAGLVGEGGVLVVETAEELHQQRARDVEPLGHLRVHRRVVVHRFAGDGL